MPVRDLSAAPGATGTTSAAFCVIGGGMAGLFVARKLAHAGRRVVVLESGKADFDEQTHHLNTIVDVHGRYTRALNGRYRGLGGSSSRWGGRMVPIYPHDTGARDYAGMGAWPLSYDDLDGYSAEIEAAFGLPHGSYGAESLRRVHLDRAFAVEDPEFRGRLAKWINFRQCNLANIWRRELDALPSLEVWLGATVTDFELDAGQGRVLTVGAKGFHGNSLRVRADHFVVAGGTIETTRLLLWLDAQSGGRAFEGTNALGRYFQDHLKSEVATISRRDQRLSNRLFGYHFIDGIRRSLHLDLTTEAQEADAAASAFVYAAMDLTHSNLSRIKSVARRVQARQLRVSDVAALVADVPLVLRSAYWRYLRQQVYMPPSVRLGVQIAIEQRPQWDNHVTLATERDGLGMPKAEVHWRPTDDDERTFRSTAARLRSYWRRSGLEDSCPLAWVVDAPEGPTRFVDVAEAYAHPSGSTRMGTDPATSVVDPDLVCHAVPNVSVASASAFPSAGSANPTFTILQLALRHADSLLGQKVAPAVRRDEALRQAGTAVSAATAVPIASATRATSSSPI